MKQILTIFAFAIFFVLTSCGNDNTTGNNENKMDSVAATDSPTSTGVLTNDSTHIKKEDTANMHH